MALKLDQKDKEILYQLDLNARKSDLKIAKELNLSREVIAYRINRLIENKVIREIYALIDPTRLGFTYYKIYLQLQYLTEKKEREIINFFLAKPNIQRLVSCSGKWDLIIGFWARNIDEFNKIFLDFSFRYGEYVMNKAFTITLTVSHYGRDYLSGGKDKHERVAYFTKRKSIVKVNRDELKILRELSKNARVPTTEIAERIKLSPRVVRYRIKKLQKEGVIQTFRNDLDLSKLDYMFLKAFFYLQNITEERIKKLINYCAFVPNAVWVISCVGTWDLEIDFEVDGIEKFNEAMKDIKRNFGDIIQGVESVIIVADHGKGSRYFLESYGEEVEFKSRKKSSR